MNELESVVIDARPRPWVRGKRRREAWVALLAHSLAGYVEGFYGVGSERQINYDQARARAKRLLAEPEIKAICLSFDHVALANVHDDLRASGSDPA